MDFVNEHRFGFRRPRRSAASHVLQPDGSIKDPALIRELQKPCAVFGQPSSVEYVRRIQESLKGISFTPTAAKPSIFVSEDRSTYICAYVDDILLIGPDEPITVPQRTISFLGLFVQRLSPVSDHMLSLTCSPS